jgi:tRNA (guanine37-N1)-methyltransferase
MILRPEPVFRAMEEVEKEARRVCPQHPSRKVLLCPQGRKFDQSLARELSGEGRLLLLCGHYEGFDERIRLGFDFLELSIGDYVLSGGEAAAMVVIDAVVRLIPGVLGDESSTESESFTEIQGESPALLEYPQYTRPREFRGMKVPEVLLSGDHEKIRKWRLEQALLRTRQRRPDLLPEE